MIKLTIFSLLSLTLSTVALADCFPLYEKKAAEIQKKDGYSTSVGGHIYQNPYSGQLGYWPGIKVAADIDNWAEDLVNAVKWGPYIYSFRSDDPRKAWLEAFRKSIKKDCKLPVENYDKLRAMLKELMEDGSFCPNNKIIDHKFLKGKNPFKDVLKKAVKDQRFAHYCQDESVADDSFRKIKDVNENDPETESSKTSSGQ